MIKQAMYIESDSNYPYFNLALEEYLLDNVEEDQIILYLWQNKHTVVIGKHQNSWKECKIRELEESGGHLVRRLSGGGAVYHDLGNLNFTFLVPTKLYDLDKQLDVILTAVQMLGMKAEKSGRNDILLNGMKFSGNAFLKRGSRSYHHGTLMVDVNMQDLQKYLNVDREKLKSKSVDSVRSRVTNLSEHHPTLTIDLLKETLIKAFGNVYDCQPVQYILDTEAEASIKEREEKFSSWDFKYGKKINFEFEAVTRFAWGGLSMQFHVLRGRIEDIVIHSDAMNQDFISQIAEAIIGAHFDKKAVIQIIEAYEAKDKQEEEMCQDMIGFIDTLEF